MPKTISSDRTEQWLIDSSNAEWTLEDSGSISANGVAILEDSPQSRNTIYLHGEVHSGDEQNGSVGLELDGSRTHVRLEKGALIDTETGIHLVGRLDKVLNKGTIDVTGTGIVTEDTITNGVRSRFPWITNHGEISGATGMQLDNAVVNNQAHGIISGVDVGISAAGVSGTTAVIFNLGTISGDVAVAGGDGVLKLDNSGHINGSILLGGGDDAAFFYSSSHVTGAVDGGEGNDDFTIDGSARFDQAIAGGAGDDIYHLVAGKPRATLVEQQDGGTDAIWADSSYTLQDNFEWLFVSSVHKHGFGNGNDADNLIYAGPSKDLLNGGAGNDVLASVQRGGLDTLIGGAGDDTFAFAHFKSVAQDFTAGEDKLAFADASGITSYDGARIEQHGDDTWIGFTKNDSFRVRAILHGVDASTLTADDFSFHYQVNPFWSEA